MDTSNHVLISSDKHLIGIKYARQNLFPTIYEKYIFLDEKITMFIKKIQYKHVTLIDILQVISSNLT